MSYYHDIITEKSFVLLQQLKHQHNFVLIGGWAVYFYTKRLKSKDIDIIVDYNELEKLRTNHDLTKNDRLKKYEIKKEGIDVDIYVPYFSELGIPAEIIIQNTTSREGFILPQIEILLILKQKAWLARKESLKGDKDRIDILSLVSQNIDWNRYSELSKENRLDPLFKETLFKLLETTREVPELNLNAHQYARLKKKCFDGFRAGKQ